MLFELGNDGCLGLLVMLVVSVIELVNAIGSAVRVVPYEFLGTIEVFAFGYLLESGEGVGKDGFEAMLFEGRR